MNRVNKWIRVKLDELKIKFGGVCLFCGDLSKLEFAHIVYTGISGKSRGRKERYYDIINNLSSYVLLCKECHTKYDNMNDIEKIDKYSDIINNFLIQINELREKGV